MDNKQAIERISVRCNVPKGTVNKVLKAMRKEIDIALTDNDSFPLLAMGKFAILNKWRKGYRLKGKYVPSAWVSEAAFVFIPTKKAQFLKIFGKERP